MTSIDDFTTTQSFTTPVTTSLILTLPSPSAVVTDVTLSASDVYKVTVYPSSVVTQVTLSSNSSTVTSTLTIPAPRPTASSSTHVSVAAPAALGAVLGLVTLASAVIIILLARKTRQLIRSTRHVEELRTVHGPPETNYALYAKEDIHQEESPSELRRQLEAVRAELTAIRLLAPSTIRDQSDYIRDLTVLNDNIRQLSLRVSSTRSRLSAATIRSKLCEALWSDIFAKFDAGLDATIERQMSDIMTSFEKASKSIVNPK